MPSALARAAWKAAACSGRRGLATVTSCWACRRASWSGGNSLKTRTFFRAVWAAILLKSCCVEFGSRRQAFAVAQHLHGTRTNPGTALHGLGHAQAVQQGADHADRKAVACAHGVDHLGHRKAGHMAAARGVL